MCGIAGIVDRSGVTEVAIEGMTVRMKRRGPDGAGAWVADGVGLGHRRLSIIDLSARANQPMGRYGGRLQVVFNGEIYNFRELRRELEALGERFETTSDTEVILAGFERWGDQLWSRLRGMFALAIWDCSTRDLVLARDPLGKKPLFWARNGERFAFASSIEALRAAFPRDFRLRPSAINDFLANTVVSGTQTIFREVERIKPAHVARLAADGSFTSRPYWQLRFANKLACSSAEASEHVEALLDEAVSRRLVSDVPLGSFLSGGFDSGLVVASMARQSSMVRTFTVGTPGSAFDERRLAAAVAEHLGTSHTEIALAPTTAAHLPRLLADVGQPFGDSSLLPSYDVARAARQAVTVVLTGDGGDEGFFGYTAHQGVLAADWLRRLLPIPSFLSTLGKLVGGEGKHAFVRRAGHVLRLAGGGIAASLYNPMGFNLGMRRALLQPDVLRDVELDEPEHHWQHLFAEADGEDAVERFAAAAIEATLCDTYLVKVDTATMATSLEARCPFLDVDLLEFAARLPRAVKFPHGRRKALLRRLVAQHLPRVILDQPKRGFSVPVDVWLRNALRPAFEEHVLGGRGVLPTIIDTREVRRLYDRHLAGENHQSRLWSLFALGVWCAVSVDGTMHADEPLGAWQA